MPKGEGIYLRGRTWWLDCVIRGNRYFRCLGKNITRTAAKELAAVERARILKGEAGIDGRKKKTLPSTMPPNYSENGQRPTNGPAR